MVSITTLEATPASLPAEQVKAVLTNNSYFFELDALSNKSGNGNKGERKSEATAVEISAKALDSLSNDWRRDDSL